MTGPEYRQALSTLGMTPVQAASWLGVSRASAYAWANSGAPGPVARALRLACGVRGALRLGMAYDQIGTIIDVEERIGGDYILAADLAPLLAMER